MKRNLSNMSETYKLKTTDNKTYTIETSLLEECDTLKEMRDVCNNNENEIPVEFSSSELESVLDCIKLSDNNEELHKKIVDMEKEARNSVINTADFMGHKKLINQICKIIADDISGKDAQYMSDKYFDGVKITDELKNQVSKDFAWLFNEKNNLTYPDLTPYDPDADAGKEKDTNVEA